MIIIISISNDGEKVDILICLTSRLLTMDHFYNCTEPKVTYSGHVLKWRDTNSLPLAHTFTEMFVCQKNVYFNKHGPQIYDTHTVLLYLEVHH